MYNIGGSFYYPCDPWKKNKRKKITAYRNYRSFQNWFTYLINLFLNTYEFEGMPDTINIRYLMQTLLCEGRVLFFKDNGMSYFALSTSAEGGFNVYYEPLKWRAIGKGYSKTYNLYEDCVLIRVNPIMYPPLFMLEEWAYRISDCERSIDVYSKSMKRPWLAVGEKDEKLTLETIIDDVDNNEIAVVGNNRIAGELTKIYPNSNDGQGLASLWKHKHETIDECLTFLGINNANTEKRERLITSEVESNNQLIQLNQDVVLDWLKLGCDEINKMFGLYTSVKIKHDYIKEDKESLEVNNE